MGLCNAILPGRPPGAGSRREKSKKYIRRYIPKRMSSFSKYTQDLSSPRMVNLGMMSPYK
jgi:hypothetical protein